MWTGKTLFESRVKGRKERKGIMEEIKTEEKKTPWYLQKEKWMWALALLFLILEFFGVPIPEDIAEHVPEIKLGAIGTLILYTVLKWVKWAIYKYIKK